MTTDADIVDITNKPELVRLADELRETKRLQVWRCNGEDVAVLVPVVEAKLTPPPKNPALDAVLAGLPPDDPIVRTAGMLHTDHLFLGHDEESEAAAIAMARDLVAYWEA